MKRTENPRKVLGKGLTALLSTRTQPTVTAPPEPNSAPPAPAEVEHYLPTADIENNPMQPRRDFDPEHIAELAQSIKANGIVQPLIVRRVEGRYQLVAGERRLRAARLIGLEKVPVVIRDIPDDHLLEITLIENIQREDLNPIETASALETLGRELNLNAEEIGQRTGKDRTTILNFMRLLQLPEDLRTLIAVRKLSQGHARCLLRLTSEELQREVAEKAMAKNWSVRRTEQTIQKMLEAGSDPKRAEVLEDPNVKAAIVEMQRTLGTRVRIIEKPKIGGKIEIDYYSQDDLDRIYSIIVRE